jgi:hypothetical protein
MLGKSILDVRPASNIHEATPPHLVVCPQAPSGIFYTRQYPYDILIRILEKQ